MKAQRRQAEYDRLAALVQSRAPKSPGEKFVAGASYRFNENPPQATGNADFIGIGGALTHIRFMPGCPRHSSPKRTVSASPELGPFLLG
jgi:hypothetical protein